MLRIVHCITGLTEDGAQGMLLRLVDALAAYGFENRVVSLQARQPMAAQFERIGVPVHSLGVDSIFSGGSGIASLRRLLRAESPDLLQGWMYHSHIALYVAQKVLQRRVPLVWNIRRGLDDIGERSLKTRGVIWANKVLSEVPERIVYCTEQSMQQHEHIGFARGKGIVIGNGFDTNRYRPRQDSRAALRARFGLLADALVIGHVGRYDLAKGHGHLFEGFSRVRSQFPQAQLVCAGRGVDWKNRDLVALLRRSGLSSCTTLLGEYSPVEELYSVFDVMCSSSIAEGFPNVIAEAMASGVPCVVTDTGASRALVEDIGIVVEPRSGGALGNALCVLCARSSDERLEMGAMGRERIRSLHSLQAVSRQYFELYGSVCAGVTSSFGTKSSGSIEGSIRVP